MKSFYFKMLLTTILVCSYFSSSAQLIGTSAYMIGDHVEVGINDAGHEGAPLLATSHNRSNLAVTSPVYFGFVANPQLDGWTDYDGDFFSPGTPENGFGLDVAGVNYANNAAGTLEQIPGSITNYYEVGDCIFVEWDGSVAGIDMHIVYKLVTTELYYTTEVTLTNVGTTDLIDTYYYRNLDPDNNVTIGGGYSTQNTIVAQPSAGCEKALVTAEQPAPWDSYIGLGAIGENFRVSHGGFTNRDGSDIWNAAGGLEGAVGATTWADQAISLAYYVDLLTPGEAETFQFTVVLDASQIDAAIASLFYLDYEGSLFGTGDACSPVVDTATICQGNPITIAIDGPGVEDYDWVWSPPTGLTVTDGPETEASPDTLTEYTLTGTPDTTCFASVIERIIVVEVLPSPEIGIEDPGPQCNEFDLTTLNVENLEGTPGMEVRFFTVVPDSADQDFGELDTTVMFPGDTVYVVMSDPDGECFDVEMLVIDFNGGAVAGPDVSDTLCNNAGSTLDLNTILVGADPDGGWAEISEVYSGGFDPATGVFDAEGVDPGEYIFEYIAYGIAPCEDDTALITIVVNREALAGADGTEQVCNADGTTTDLNDLLFGNNDIGVWVETTASGQFDPVTGILDAGGLAPGDYLFTYTVDADPPCVPDVADFTVTVLPNPVIDAGVDFAVCDGNDCTLAADGAGPGGTYIWDGGVIDGVAFTPDETDTYTVTGTDANGCSGTDDIIVTVNPLPFVDAGADALVCTGDSITLTATGAGVGAVYVWDGGVTDGYTFLPVTTETYTVTATDINGCENTDAITVTVNDLPEIEAGEDLTMCWGDLIVLEGDGGGPDAEYVWTEGGIDGDPFSPDTTGMYWVTGTDIYGCTNVDSMTIYVNPLPLIEAGLDLEICDGDLVTLEGLGAGPDGVYEWDGCFDGVAFSPSETALYTVTGTDTNGCVNTDSVWVEVNELPVIVAGPDVDICIGDEVTLSGTGAGAGGTYTWDAAITDGVPFSPVATSTYTVTGTDINGCSNSDAVVVGILPLPDVTAGPDLEICIGESVTLTGGGAGPAGVYVWDGDITNGVPFSPIETSIYSVIGTTIDGCSNSDDVLVTVNPLPEPVFTADELAGCSPFHVNFSSLTPGTEFNWEFGDGDEAYGEEVEHVFIYEGTYDVTLTMTSPEGCTSIIIYNNYIEVLPTPIAAFTYSPGELDVNHTKVDFENMSENATYYTWSFGDGSEEIHDENPTHVFPIEGNRNYRVELLAENDIGCSDVAEEIITVKDALLYYVPNAFTPDGNSFNEDFRPIFVAGLDVYDYHLMIFNRWGELVFESFNADFGWDGTYGSGGIVQDGIYVWRIEFGETMSDDKHLAEGHVTLMR